MQPGFIALFYGVCVPNLASWQQQVGIGIANGVIAVAVVGFGLKAALTDPLAHRPEAEEDNRYCSICQISVKPGALHCRECEKCVDGFDHHCLWLVYCRLLVCLFSFAGELLLLATICWIMSL